jgi:hypothetical protein
MVEEVVRQGTYWASESLQLCQHVREEKIASIQGQWERPATDMIKLNIDGAFVENTKSGGWGFVARDHLGCVMGSGAGRLNNIGSAIQAEATAC